MFIVLKHACYWTTLSWTSLLLYFVFTNFFETGKKLTLTHKETKAQRDYHSVAPRGLQYVTHTTKRLDLLVLLSCNLGKNTSVLCLARI